jgi:hypothetical protein
MSETQDYDKRVLRNQGNFVRFADEQGCDIIWVKSLEKVECLLIASFRRKAQEGGLEKQLGGFGYEEFLSCT